MPPRRAQSLREATREGDSWKRPSGSVRSAFGGLGFVVLAIVISVLPGSLPKPSDSQAKIAKFLYDNSKELRWSASIGAAALVLLFWWVGAVWRMLRRAEGGTPRLAVVALAGDRPRGHARRGRARSL